MTQEIAGNRHGRRLGPFVAAAVAGAALAGAVAFAPASAQAPAPAAAAEPTFDPAVVARGFTVWKEKVGCSACHGWAGNGVPDDPRSPVGANLRATALDHAGLVEVIKCGLIGTGMPHFDARAYSDDRCYGLTREQLGDQTPVAAETTLIAREMEAVATYIEAKMKGRGPFTNEECEEYFGAGAQFCVSLTSNRGAVVPGAGAAGAHGP